MSDHNHMFPEIVNYAFGSVGVSKPHYKKTHKSLILLMQFSDAGVSWKFLLEEVKSNLTKKAAL